MATFAAVAQSELILIKWPKLERRRSRRIDRVPQLCVFVLRATCYVLRATKKNLKCVRTFKMRVRKEVGRQQKTITTTRKFNNFAFCTGQRDFMILLFVGFNDNDDDQ